MHADVYLNGMLLASHPYGYTTFEVDLTAHLAPAGKPNTLAVRVASMGSNSRWYAGAGIFRHVWLITAPAVSVGTFGGVRVASPMAGIDLAGKTAGTSVTTTVTNAGAAAADATVTAALPGLAGGAAQSSKVSVPAGGAVNVTLKFAVSGVAFWSPDSPTLYAAAVTVAAGGDVDSANVTFGIRKVSALSSTLYTPLVARDVRHPEGERAAGAVGALCVGVGRSYGLCRRSAGTAA